MNTKRILPIFFIVFTNLLGGGVILPVLPLYAEGQFSATVAQAALLSTAYFAAQFIAAPWLGRLSDRHGRRPILIVSQIGTLLSFVLFIFAGQIGAAIDGLRVPLSLSGGLIMLYTARILDGLTGGNITTAQAYVSDVTPEEHRAQGLGFLSAAFGLGFIFGPAFGGVLAGSYGATAPFVGAAIITAGTLLLTTFTLKESLPPEARAQKQTKQKPTIPFSTLLADRTFALVLVIGFVGALAYSAIPPTFALYVDHVLFAGVADPAVAPRSVGLMMAFLGLASVITQAFLLKPLVGRLGERSVVVLGQMTLLASLLAISIPRNPVLVTLLLAPMAFARGINDPSLQALVTRFGDEHTRGRLLGVYQSALSLAFIFGPIWGGFVFERLRPQAIFYGAAMLLLVSVTLSLLLVRRQSPAPEAQLGEAG